ncbi:CxxC motif-containing protein [Mobilisporobacter senegalensis]|uniref:CxxC motif-containing protein n=1 Tax=Mobilisporobacter senegalensis TaxID=1329262 RepID=A0A3N1XW13_9FIRM|nr:DUF1667 domain-containing protein [Mobilisporobacter senegalensis]ROR29117.1 CxxC motif-containing protein [Mobilisporobacter senegalensis]
MEEKKEITCIGCPIGCMLEVTLEYNEVKDVKGYTCLKGKTYAIKECTNPTRILTSTVKVKNGTTNMVSVKTIQDIPKDKIKECMDEIKGLAVKAPIHAGDIIVSNVAGTMVDIIATKDVPEHL